MRVLGRQLSEGERQVMNAGSRIHLLEEPDAVRRGKEADEGSSDFQLLPDYLSIGGGRALPFLRGLRLTVTV